MSEVLVLQSFIKDSTSTTDNSSSTYSTIDSTSTECSTSLYYYFYEVVIRI